MGTMQSKLPEFYSSHPEYRGIIGLCITGWEEMFGNELMIDIAETSGEARDQYRYWTAEGWIFKDQNMFGDCNDTYTISCFAKPGE